MYKIARVVSLGSGDRRPGGGVRWRKCLLSSYVSTIRVGRHFVVINRKL